MDRKQVRNASTLTTLAWGAVRAPVALYKIDGDVDEASFDTLREPEPAVVPDSPEEVELSLAEEGPGDPLGLVREDTVKLGGEALHRAAAEAFSASPEPPAQRPARPKPRKGIYREDESFLDLTEQLERIDEATQLDALTVVGFIRRERVSRMRIRGAYYLAGDGGTAPRALKALLHGMHATGRVAICKWTKRSRQAIGVVVPDREHPGAILVLELVFSANLREPSPRCFSHQQAELTEAEKKLAYQLVKAMTATADVVGALEDDAITQRAALRAAAEAGLVDAWEAPEVPNLAATEDIEAALRGSV